MAIDYYYGFWTLVLAFDYFELQCLELGLGFSKVK
jgi:hypothetical protein